MFREILVHGTGTFKYGIDDSSVRRAIDASQQTVNDTVEKIQYSTSQYSLAVNS
jgi:hypothetical protein